MCKKRLAEAVPQEKKDILRWNGWVSLFFVSCKVYVVKSIC